MEHKVSKFLPDGREHGPGVVVGEQLARGSSPAARARASVSGVTIAPALSSAAVDAVGVGGERADAGRAVERERRAPSRNSVLRPPRPSAAHRHRGLAAREQHAGRRRRAGRAGATAGRCRPCTRPTSRASPSIASPRISGVTPARRAPPRPPPRGDACGVAIDDGLGARQAAGRRAWASRPRRCARCARTAGGGSMP